MSYFSPLFSTEFPDAPLLGSLHSAPASSFSRVPLPRSPLLCGHLCERAPVSIDIDSTTVLHPLAPALLDLNDSSGSQLLRNYQSIQSRARDTSERGCTRLLDWERMGSGEKNGGPGGLVHYNRFFASLHRVH